jgi:Ca2+-binding EF-hand superfamily protein
MSFNKKSPDLGRISIYDLNTDDIELSSSEIQLKKHTGYDEEHLKRLKYLFQQITGPETSTLDVHHFESAARSICQSLTESSRAHHLAEILFKAYDKNINGSIDFSEMIDFVW